MQMDTISLFCQVAQCRSVSKAAEDFGMTQSAVSQRIRALEKELGVELMDRSKRPLELTAAGETYWRGCRKIVEQYHKLCEQLTGGAKEGAALRGEVTVAAIYSAGIDLLNQVKADFEAEHPRVTVSISYLQPATVYDWVRQGDCDIGILSYPERWRGLGSVRLRDEAMSVVMRSGHALAGRGTIHASELAGREMVSFEMTLPIGRRLHRYLRDHGVMPQVVNQFDNIDTIKTYVSETDTVAILPDRTVAREVGAGVLATVALEPKVVRPLGIVYERQREQGPLVKAFIEYLIRHQPTDRKSAEKTNTNVAALSA